MALKSETHPTQLLYNGMVYTAYYSGAGDAYEATARDGTFSQIADMDGDTPLAGDDVVIQYWESKAAYNANAKPMAEQTVKNWQPKELAPNSVIFRGQEYEVEGTGGGNEGYFATHADGTVTMLGDGDGNVPLAGHAASLATWASRDAYNNCDDCISTEEIPLWYPDRRCDACEEVRAGCLPFDIMYHEDEPDDTDTGFLCPRCVEQSGWQLMPHDPKEY